MRLQQNNIKEISDLLSPTHTHTTHQTKIQDSEILGFHIIIRYYHFFFFNLLLPFSSSEVDTLADTLALRRLFCFRRLPLCLPERDVCRPDREVCRPERGVTRRFFFGVLSLDGLLEKEELLSFSLSTEALLSDEERSDSIRGRVLSFLLPFDALPILSLDCSCLVG